MSAAALTIQTAAAEIARGELKARDLVADYIERAKAANDSLHAYLRFTEESALSDAEEIDRRIASGEELGPLAGIPVAIKDNMNLQGCEISAGSRMLEGFVSPFTATAVERLRAAGAVIIGICNMDEFAMGSSTENSAFACTRNPRAPDYVPGGSSGGSAAAVAADLALGSLGSDTGGSIRLPASFCGTVGLKPTYGRVSRYGLISYASSLDQIGPFAKTVADAAMLLEAIAGLDRRDSSSLDHPLEKISENLDRDISGVRIGVPREFFGDGFNSSIKNDVLAAIANLAAQGAEIVEISLPMLEYSLASYYLIACAEASSNLERFDGVRFGMRAPDCGTLHEMMAKTRSAGFGPEVQRRIILGTYILSAGYYEAYYLKAQKVRTLIQQDFARAFDQVDIVVGPVSPVPPFRFGEKMDDPLAMYLTDVATVSANLAGLPALSIPCGTSDDGLPTGLQLMARHLEEKLLLNVAHRYEQNRDESAEPFDVKGESLRSLENQGGERRIEIPVERIAELAMLDFDDDGIAGFVEDIGELIGYAELLDDVDTDAVEPTTHPVECRQLMRSDEVERFAEIDALLANAPARDGSAYSIPNIM